MPRKRKQAARDDSIRKEQEALSKEIRLSGVGEDPAVQALLKEFSDADPAKALEILSALQRHIQGTSDLDDPEQRTKLVFLTSKASEVEAAEKAWNENRTEFIQNVFDRNPPIEGRAGEQIKARAALKFQEAIAKKRSESQMRQINLSNAVKNGPKEEIFVTGHFENINGEVLLLPDEIRIMNFVWRFAPGKHVVPAVVAQAYRNLQSQRAEREARRLAMSASDGIGMEMNEFNRKQKEIDKEFTKSDFTGGLNVG